MNNPLNSNLIRIRKSIYDVIIIRTIKLDTEYPTQQRYKKKEQNDTKTCPKDAIRSIFTFHI